jgi:hypothetical protein
MHYANFNTRFIKNKNDKVVGVSFGYSFTSSHENGIRENLLDSLRDNDEMNGFSKDLFKLIEEDGSVFIACDDYHFIKCQVNKTEINYKKRFGELRNRGHIPCISPKEDVVPEVCWDSNGFAISGVGEAAVLLKELYHQLLKEGEICSGRNNRYNLVLASEIQELYDQL